jgi:chaperone modulatory protein CbpM
VTALLSEKEFLEQTQVTQITLRAWISEEWLRPAESAGEITFTEIDLARARFIADLQRDMGVNEAGVGVILHLVDQLHGLRRAMNDLLGAAPEQRKPPIDV